MSDAHPEWSRLAALALASLLLIGCAAPLPRVFSFAQSGANPVWPDASSGDPPRYALEGYLLGESNYRTESRSAGRVTRAWQWLAGIAGTSRKPLNLLRPQCIASNATADRIYVTDAGRGAIFVFEPERGSFEVWSRETSGLDLEEPIGIAVLPDGDVLVADAGRRGILRLDVTGRARALIGVGELQRPTGLAVDAARGHVYVADTPAHRIVKFDLTGVVQARVGARGDNNEQFNYPTHLAWGADRLWVTDSINGRIQAFDTNGQNVGSVGRPGLFVGDLVRPKGVAVDRHGHLLVVESLYSYLLVFRPDGQFLMGLGGTGSGAGQLLLPSGVWADSRDRVYVADMYNARVGVLRELGENRDE